ncbi:MAG: divalent-cation tolerance protein CutA [Halobacteria archaeon]|nr:divalent-cation tolerance protein CutA [Halobacteria archaeon]
MYKQTYTVYTTAPEGEARQLARSLVEEQLAACVNLHDIDSVYRWEGEIVEEGEVALDVKTAVEYDALEERLVDMHPYDVPPVLRFEPDEVNDEYDDWVRDVSL